MTRMIHRDRLQFSPINKLSGLKGIHTTTHKVEIHKAIPYSTGNSTQYSVMTYMREESEKEWIYVYADQPKR